MSLREDLLPLVDACRGITEDLDQRTTGLTVRIRTWSGLTIGQTVGDDDDIAVDGASGAVQINTTTGAIQTIKSFSDSDLIFPKRYHIKNLKPDQQSQLITASGGRFQPGHYVKLWVTPSFAGGGYTQQQLVPRVVNDNQEVIYVLSGPGLNGNFNLVTFNSDRPYRYELILRERNDSPVT